MSGEDIYLGDVLSVDDGFEVKQYQGLICYDMHD